MTSNILIVICDNFAVVGAWVASIVNDGHVSVREHSFRYPIKRKRIYCSSVHREYSISIETYETIHRSSSTVILPHNKCFSELNTFPPTHCN